MTRFVGYVNLYTQGTVYSIISYRYFTLCVKKKGMIYLSAYKSWFMMMMTMTMTPDTISLPVGNPAHQHRETIVRILFFFFFFSPFTPGVS